MPQDHISSHKEGLWQAAFHRFATYADEIETLVHLHMSAVSRLIGIPEFLKALYEPDDSEWMISANSEAKRAQDEVSKGFPLLHAHSLLGLWSALEALMEDVAVAWFTDKPETLQRPDFSKIRVPIVEFRSLSIEDQMSYLISEMQRDLKSDLRLGVGRFERLLDAIGMGGSTPKEVGKAIYEAQQVRNVIAHRGGIADKKLVEACPWLSLTSGQAVTVSHKRFMYYLKATHIYVLGLVNRFRTFEGMQPITYNRGPLEEPPNESTSNAVDLIEHIAEPDIPALASMFRDLELSG